MEPQFDQDPLGLDLEASSAALAPSTVLGQGRSIFLSGLRQGSKRGPHDTTECLTCQLALKYRLSLSETKRIMNEFQTATKNAEGGLDREAFDMAVIRIFDVKSIDDDVAASAYRAADMQQQVSIEAFLVWYLQNMFTQVNSMNCAKDKLVSEGLIYKIAEKHNVSTMIVDKVKVKFDYYDTDKSGAIDYREFTDMFCSILKTKTASDINQERLKRFWKEIDTNGDNGVCFGEFAEWYLKYFSLESDSPTDFEFAGPLRAFYDSYDPRIQRRNSLNGLSKLASIN